MIENQNPRIVVPHDQSLWPADEVPRMTASALYHFEAEPDPVVPKEHLQRVTLIWLLSVK